MASVLPKNADMRPNHLADGPMQAIEFALQELVAMGASNGDVANSGAAMSNDSSLVTAIQTSLAARV